ncbi:MAG: iron export ABC transporter permease subunit FetB [Candidatus Kuenenia stuttgartiensis]|nr:MAG: iron export ABC transporter permease subunit FetB [Candidatus Kuenenia stuttgartiensis]
MNNAIDIPWSQLSFCSVFVILLIGISLYESLRLEKTILIGSFRAVIQLILVGFFIKLIFDYKQWYVVMPILLVMIFVASQTVIKWLKNPVKGMYCCALISVSLASAFSLLFIFLLVVRIPVWYDPQYLIPVAGMIIANGMNGAALAGERYKSELEIRVPEIEMLLSLGYESKMASRKSRQQALSASLIPSLNSMMVMGIVHLPGMMTGQIIAGSSPVTAVKYQIIIILSIAATVALTSWVFVLLLDKKFFTPYHQIRYELVNPGKRKK